MTEEKQTQEHTHENAHEAEHKNEQAENIAENKKEEKKPAHKEKPRKTEAFARGVDLPASTKHFAAICKFVKGKKIHEAIKDLEQVVKLRKAVPMRGEIPHRHGKDIMAGRFPKKAAGEFIILLKSLAANATHLGIEDPIITTAIANIGSRPFGKYGIRRKRTHIALAAKTVQKGLNNKK